MLVGDNLPSTFSLPDGEKIPGRIRDERHSQESDYGRYTSETEWSSPSILRGDVEEAHAHPGRVGFYLEGGRRRGGRLATVIVKDEVGSPTTCLGAGKISSWKDRRIEWL